MRRTWRAAACCWVYTVVFTCSRYGQRVSAQRAKSAVTASHRSIHPAIPGLPWWAAVVIAATATAIGFAFDAGSGNKELTHVFAALYVMGCAFAVLAVRQSGIFTAVIQPPLILFCAVPGAYWVFHGAKIAGVKDILINCGYPLIERFPLMLFTSAGVLLVGFIRWYVGMAAHGRTRAETEEGAADNGGGKRRIADILAAVWRRDSTDDTGSAEPKPRRRARATDRASRTGRPAGGARTTRRTASTRSRHARTLLDDQPGPAAGRARRPRPMPARDIEAAEPPALQRRRPRPSRDPELRSQPPREIRRDPHVRAGRPAARSSRFDPYDSVDSYEPPPRRRPKPESAGSANATHHPISRVRYRGAAHTRQTSAAESWEYDI